MLISNGTRDHRVVASVDEHAKHHKPRFMSKRTKCFNSPILRFYSAHRYRILAIVEITVGQWRARLNCL